VEDVPDIDTIMSSDAFASPAQPTPPLLPALDDVRVGELTLIGVARAERDHGCDGAGRVPTNHGYWSGSDAHDWCSTCFDVPNEHNLAPNPEEQARRARHGVASTGKPIVVQVWGTVDAELAALQDLVDRFGVPRVVVQATPSLQEWLDAGGSLPPDVAVMEGFPGTHVHYRGMTNETYRLQLAGLAHGTRIHPELQARLDAASDGGVIRDADLANEYFEAMVAQNESSARLRRTPEPVIESGGRIFPSLDADRLD
jgi:hypothetical protein